MMKSSEIRIKLLQKNLGECFILVMHLLKKYLRIFNIVYLVQNKKKIKKLQDMKFI